jgi:hypothetical protein
MKESTGNEAALDYINTKKNREITVPETGIEPWN